jgi:hypothetical protein
MINKQMVQSERNGDLQFRDNTFTGIFSGGADPSGV